MKKQKLLLIVVIVLVGLFIKFYYVRKPDCKDIESNEPLYAVKKDGHYSYVNSDGDVVIKTYYDDIEPFDFQGYAQVTTKRGVALIDRSCNVIEANKNGDYAIKPLLHYPGYYEVSYKKMVNDKLEYRKKIIDRDNNEVLNVKALRFDYQDYNKISAINADGDEGLYKYEDGKFSELLDIKYENATFMSDGFDYYYEEDHQHVFVKHDGTSMTFNDVIDSDRHLPGLDGFNEGFSKGVILVNSNGKWALLHKSGQLLTEFNYTIDPHLLTNIYQHKTKNVFLNSDLIVLKKDSKYGILNLEGEVLLDFIYDDLDVILDYDQYVNTERADRSYKQYVIAKQNNKWALLDKDFNTVTNYVYDQILSFSEGYAGVKKNDKWTFIDDQGKELTEFSYDAIWGFEGGYSLVIKDGKYGLINNHGTQVIDPVYDELYSKSFITMDSLKGSSLNINDAKVLPEEWKGLFKNRVAVKKDGKWGYFDQTGAQITEMIYDDMQLPFNNLNTNRKWVSQYVAVSIGHKWSILNTRNGEHVTEFIDANIESYLGDGKFEVEWNDNKCEDGYNCDTQVIDIGVKHDFDIVDTYKERVHNGHIFSYEDTSYIYKNHSGYYGVLDLNESIIINPNYNLIKYIRTEDGVKYVTLKNHQYSILDREGTMKSTGYAEDIKVIDKYIAFKKNDKWGLMNHNGEVFLKPQYDEIYEYETGFNRDLENYVKVKLGESYGLINTLHSVTIPTKYKEFQFYERNDKVILIMAKDQDNKWVLYDYMGNQLLDDNYKQISFVWIEPKKQVWVKVKSDNGWGLFDQNGHRIIDSTYEEIILKN